MYTRIFPLIHKYTLRNIHPKKFPWGWRSQKQIRKIIVQNVESKHQPCHFNETIQKKIKFNEPEFLQGAIQGYRKIFKQFSKKRDFFELCRIVNCVCGPPKTRGCYFMKYLPSGAFRATYAQ